MEGVNHLPLITLNCNGHRDHEEEDVDFSLTSLLPQLPQRTPNLPINPSQSANNNQMVLILNGGGISFAALQVSTRIYQIVVDISGIPLINSVAVLKSLVADSWIVTSNILALLAGRDLPEDAIVRALIMLLAKRVIGIKQLGFVREILVLLSFIKLASEAMTAVGYHEELATTFNQIASLPMLFYTALARIAVDKSITVDKSAKDWLTQLPDAARGASSFRINVNNKGQIGVNGRTLKANWKAVLEKHPQMSTYVRRNAIKNQDQAIASLSGFARLI